MLLKAIYDEVLHLAHNVKEHDKLYVRMHLPNCMKVDLSVMEQRFELYEDQRFAESLRALYAYLNSLSPDVLEDLLTLMFLGRSEYKAETTDQSGYTRIRELAIDECRRSDKKMIICILVENILLCDYMETGYKVMAKFAAI